MATRRFFERLGRGPTPDSSAPETGEAQHAPPAQTPSAAPPAVDAPAPTAFKDLVQFAPDAIVVVDAAGIVRHAAPSVTTVLGHHPDRIEGLPFSALASADDAVDLDRFLHNVSARADGTPTTSELRLRRADGSVMYGEATGASMLTNPDARGMVITIRDISARKSLEEQLRFQAFHDALTGLANRALFVDRLERALRVRRGPGEIAPAVAFLDLDDFKVVNDTYGHGTGDRVLQIVAERLTTCLRSADTAGRLGGDEFVILVEDPIQAVHLRELVQRVVDAINQPMLIDDWTVTVGASAGVAAASSEVTHAHELLRRADLAMYRAKAEGKGRVVVFDATTAADVGGDADRVDALRVSIAEHAITTWFTPVVDLSTGGIVTAETTVGWNAPGLAGHGIESIIDLAVSAGLAPVLFDEVVAQVVDALDAWSTTTTGAHRRPRLSPIAATVQIPPALLADADFAERVAARCDAVGVDHRRIMFEVSEAVLADDDSVATLRSWAAAGFGLSVEHFGSGASSARLLERIPLRRLTIDEAYVAYLRGTREPALMRSLIALAEQVGADTVADGVDSFEAAESLWAMGCVAAKGSAFGVATDVAGLSQLLDEEMDRAWTGFPV